MGSPFHKTKPRDRSNKQTQRKEETGHSYFALTINCNAVVISTVMNYYGNMDKIRLPYIRPLLLFIFLLPSQSLISEPSDPYAYWPLMLNKGTLQALLLENQGQSWFDASILFEAMGGASKREEPYSNINFVNRFSFVTNQFIVLDFGLSFELSGGNASRSRFIDNEEDEFFTEAPFAFGIGPVFKFYDMVTISFGGRLISHLIAKAQWDFIYDITKIGQMVYDINFYGNFRIEHDIIDFVSSNTFAFWSVPTIISDTQGVLTIPLPPSFFALSLLFGGKYISDPFIFPDTNHFGAYGMGGFEASLGRGFFLTLNGGYLIGMNLLRSDYSGNDENAPPALETTESTPILRLAFVFEQNILSLTIPEVEGWYSLTSGYGGKATIRLRYRGFRFQLYGSTGDILEKIPSWDSTWERGNLFVLGFQMGVVL